MNLDIKNEDQELLKRIKENDDQSLKILFKKYFNSLCFFSFQIVKRSELAEEVVADIFSNIWIKRKDIIIRTNFKTYLYQAVRNQSINYLKQNKLFFENLDELNKLADYTSESPVQILDYQELEKQIDNVLKKLPDKRRLIFRMNRIDGLSYKEIADILSISLNTVQNQMVKAVKFLSSQYSHLKKQ